MRAVETQEQGEEQQFTFDGHQHEVIAGLDYHRDRWLDPAVGQWVSEEPVECAGDDANLRPYVGT